MYGVPECVLDDEMFTIRPQPASIMSGSTAWIMWKTPCRFTLTMRCQSSNEILRNGLNPSTPAAFTKMLTGPRFSWMLLSAASIWARSVTSAAYELGVSEDCRSMVATR